MASGNGRLDKVARIIRARSALVGLLGATCLSVACYAQDAGQLVLSSEFSSFPARRPKVIQPVKALKPPDLDGVLDDACWGPCIPQELGSEMGGPVTRSTLVRACYDEVALYFAFECGEPLFDQMKITQCGRDGKVYNTEDIEILLAPDGVGQKRIQLCVSPAPGSIWDGRYGYIDDPLNPLNVYKMADVSWNANVSTAYKLDAANKRWTMEIAFPFSELDAACPSEGARWRGNLGRERHRSVWDSAKWRFDEDEIYLWAPNLQGAGIPDPAAFGDLLNWQMRIVRCGYAVHRADPVKLDYQGR